MGREGVRGRGGEGEKIKLLFYSNFKGIKTVIFR
jgi:hypothetical protein